MIRAVVSWGSHVATATLKNELAQATSSPLADSYEASFGQPKAGILASLHRKVGFRSDS